MKKTMVAAIIIACSGLAYGQSGSSPNGVLSSGNGRFVFGQISEYARHQYMLDTQTGRLWKLVKNTPKKPDGAPDEENSYVVLDWIPYVSENGKLSVTPPAIK